MSKTSRITKRSVHLLILLIITATCFVKFLSQPNAVTSVRPLDTSIAQESSNERKLLLVEEGSNSTGSPEPVAFLSNPDSQVFRGDNNVMLFPDVHRVKRNPVKGSVFRQPLFKVEHGEPNGELTFTEETKSAIEARVDLSAVREFLLSDAQYFPIPVSESKLVLFDVQSVEEQGVNTVSLVGKVKDRPFTQVRFAFHDGAVAGSVELLDEPTYYNYGMAGNGNVAIRQLDMEQNIYGTCANCDGTHQHGIFDQNNQDGQVTEIDNPVFAASASSDYDHVIDGVLGYTTAAKNSMGGTAAMEAKILLSTGFINDALANSNITDTVVTLLGTVEEVGHNKGLVATFEDLKNSNSLNITDLWWTLGADYMALVYNGGGGVADLDGIKYVIGSNGLDNSADSVVHEFGHLLGCVHSWGDTEGTLGTNKTSSNFGWRFRPEGGAKTRTVMSYSGGWATLRIGYFSNPDVLFRDAPTGVVNGYDASQDSTIDPQLISGGAIGSAGNGYDGTNPHLGANNRGEIQANRITYVNKGSRKAMALVNPAGGLVYHTGRDQLIYWIGGDNTQQTEVELYKGGVFHSTIASLSGAQMRSYDWVIPDVPNGEDYSIRVSIEGETPFSSELFEIQQIEAFSEDISIAAISGLPRQVTLPSIPDVTFEYTISQPSNGTITGTPPNLIYTPNAGASSDSFTYSIGLEGESSETATVSIKVASIVAHWPLDDGAGSVVTDVSGNGHHGTLTSAVWLPEGKVDGALEFNGGTGSVALPSSAFTGVANEMTLSMWVNGDVSRSVADSVFSMQDANGSSIMHVRLGDQIGTSNRIYWSTCIPQGCNTLFSDVATDEVRGEWNHYVFVKNAESGTMKVYLNGVSEHELVNFLPISEAATAYLGSETTSTGNYHGLLDNVKLYDVEMEPETVADLYRRETREPPTAVAQTVNVAKNGSTEGLFTSSAALATYTIVDLPTNGFLSSTGSAWTYTPDTNFEGSDSFTFYPSAEGLTGSPVTVSLNVIAFPSSISIPPTAASSGYHVTTSEATAFRSTGVAKNFDADADDVYGTAGYYFYGNGEDSSTNSDGTPSWVTSVGAVADTVWTTDSYTDFDNPTAAISANVADWTSNGIGQIDTDNTTGGLWAELLTFTVDANAPRHFRLGVMAGNNDLTNGRWDPAALRVSFEGGVSVEAAGLEITNLGMVFFDVALDDGVSGSFSIEGQNRDLGGSTKGPSIAGITFDEAEATQNLSAYAAWVAKYPNLRNTSFGSDPDQDGLTNGMEYALATNPDVASPEGLPEVEALDEQISFSFKRLQSSTADVTVILEYSTSLQSDEWTSVIIPITEANGVQITQAINGIEQVKVMIDRSIIEGGKLFARIKVLQFE